MVDKIPWFIKPYVNWLLALAKGRIERKEIEPQSIYVLGLASFATNWVIWNYSILSHLFIEEPLVHRLSYVFSIIHSLGPVLIAFNVRLKFVGSVLLGACMAQQILLGYFTGGFTGNVLVWYGVSPILAGILVGYRGVIVWSLSVLLSAGGFISFMYLGYNFPNLLIGQGLFWFPLFTVSGWAVCVVVIIAIFIFQRNTNEKELLEKSSRVENLLRILTHDVSNSLYIINTASTLFQKYDRDRDNVSYYFEKMDLASANISEVIESVRALHAAESEWDSIKPTACQLLDPIERCLKLLEGRLLEKGLKVEIDQDSLRKAAVMVDPRYFNNHVLMNVLSNAIKYSFKGGRITISGHEQGRGFALVVRDHGVGMNSESLKLLFKEKYDKSTPGTEGERGSGFGMLILKSFMERFDGKVWVHSRPIDMGGEHGTKVTLLFKVAPASSVDIFDGNNFGFGDFVVKGVEAEKAH